MHLLLWFCPLLVKYITVWWAFWRTSWDLLRNKNTFVDDKMLGKSQHSLCTYEEEWLCMNHAPLTVKNQDFFFLMISCSYWEVLTGFYPVSYSRKKEVIKVDKT